ncbi:MAG TPA: glycosyltransferase family 87 protein [Candidatus Limnocylindrales bacterium]|nr:glycosyltransferase family 87 protein [Candidatus Limnocylindrales bacterium]
MRTSIADAGALLHTMLRRAAVALLLGLNLAAGLYRYAHPYLTGQDHLLWDLLGGIRIARACDPAIVAASAMPAQCEAPVPYLAGAFVFFRWLDALPWAAVMAMWFALAVPATLWICHRTAERLRRGLDPPSARAVLVATASLLAFKGTTLGLYAGNVSLATTWLLGAFCLIELVRRRGWEWPAALLLAVAASKPNMAAPFFLYLLLAGDWRALVLSLAATALLHVPATFAYFGPLRHLEILFTGLVTVETYPLNATSLLGASGRVDLRPFLQSLGLPQTAALAAAAALVLGAGAAVVRYRRRFGDRLLLLNANLLFFAAMYHRDYDVLLLLLIALPLIWKHRRRFGLLACMLALPAALPLQFLHAYGMQHLPQHEPVWNMLGTSMIVSILGIGAWLNWCALTPRPVRPDRHNRDEQRLTQSAPDLMRQAGAQSAPDARRTPEERA